MLVAVAYRILGSVAGREDVVQEAWLRWSRVDESDVEDPKAFLITVTSRLAIDTGCGGRSRGASRTWVRGCPSRSAPRPTWPSTPSWPTPWRWAMLVVLETLSPLERAVFVLREAFDLPFSEIAEIIGRAEPATSSSPGGPGTTCGTSGPASTWTGTSAGGSPSGSWAPPPAATWTR
ncbi:hypothetical protein GCM10020220_114210 [Nonomuraea rubra]